MAASEARAAWQRMANRCFVQEDAKRAPKLACCPSSTNPQAGFYSGDAVKGWEHPPSTFMNHYWNPTHSNLPADLKWWFQIQPNFVCEKDSGFKQIHTLEGTFDKKTSDSRIPSTMSDKSLEASSDVDATSNLSKAYPESPMLVSAKTVKTDPENKAEGLKAAHCDASYVPDCKPNLEHWHTGDALMDWEAGDQLMSTKLSSSAFNLDSHWQGGEKTEPWWRTADGDELATLVAKKSLEHFDNCDLPRPQKVHVSKDPLSFSHSFSDKGFFGSCCSGNTCDTIIDQVEYTTSSFSHGNIDKEEFLSGISGYSTYTYGDSVSSENITGATIDFRERSYVSNGCDPSNVQLLEALCHSQSRAREAEVAAERAYHEKEHIVKLLFRQASHLFAYKQWLRLLQLESLSLQLRFKDHHISSLLSDLPWLPPLKGNNFGTNKRRDSKKHGRKKHKCGICRYLLAFALGLGLVGAGLLLGWTLGWLLPV